MPKRVPKHNVVTTRKGKVIEAKAGEPFDFTDEEVDHLTQAHGKTFLSNKAIVEIATEEDPPEEEPVEGDPPEEAPDEGDPPEDPPAPAAKKVVAAVKKTTAGL